MSHARETPAPDASRGYEASDASVPRLAFLGLGLVVLLVLSVLAVKVILDWLTPAPTGAPPTGAAPAARTAPLPQRAGELEETRRRERVLLETYDVLDAEADRYRIPIERAMDLLIERGLPVRDGERREQ